MRACCSVRQLHLCNALVVLVWSAPVCSTRWHIFMSQVLEPAVCPANNPAVCFTLPLAALWASLLIRSGGLIYCATGR